MSIRYLFIVPVALMDGDAFRAVTGGIVGGVYLLVAAFLWFFPMTVAHRLIPRTSFPERMTIPAFSAARVGGALIGLWLFARSVTSLTGYFFAALISAAPGSFLGSLSIKARIEAVVLIAELVLSVFLIIRSSYSARIVVPGNDNDR